MYRKAGLRVRHDVALNVWLSQARLQTVSDVSLDAGTDGYRFTVQYEYDPQSGALVRVVNANDQSKLYWEATQNVDAMDAAGHLQAFTLGNGVETIRMYNPATGRIENITSGVGATSSAVQNLGYQWDSVGNQTQRQDFNQNLIEQFSYDPLNRLSSSQLTVNGQTAINLSLGYDAIGKIKSKSGVGTYTYEPNRPHAIQSISGTVNTTYTYDANGNTVDRQRQELNRIGVGA